MDFLRWADQIIREVAALKRVRVSVSVQLRLYLWVATHWTSA
jgi:hypothetical protein